MMTKIKVFVAVAAIQLFLPLVMSVDNSTCPWARRQNCNCKTKTTDTFEIECKTSNDRNINNKLTISGTKSEILLKCVSLKASDKVFNLLPSFPENFLDENITLSMKFCPTPKRFLVVSAKFPNLIKLDLSKTNIESLTENFFVKESSVENLDIASCSISKLSENSFDHLVNLQILNISNNRIKEIGSKIFAKTPKLTIFKMDKNYDPQLGLKIGDNVFSNLLSLEKVSMIRSSIKYLPENVFKNCLNLDTIDLSKNNIKEVLRYFKIL